MSDTIIGISVLQPVWTPGIYRLWFRARKGTGEIAQGEIFIKDAKSQGLYDKMPDHSEGTNSIWKFTRAGDMLNCSPSVNWISWGFHNAGSWSTRYVEMIHSEEPYSENPRERGRHEYGHSVHYDINLIEGREQGMINELKASGHLLQNNPC